MALTVHVEFMDSNLRRRTDKLALVALLVHDITLSLSSLSIALFTSLHCEIHVVPVFFWNQSKV